MASERAVDSGEWWRLPLGSHVPQPLISLKGVRGSTFLLVTVQEWGPSPGNSVDRIDVVWLGQSPELGQRDGRPAEHRKRQQAKASGLRRWEVLEPGWAHLEG